MLFIDYQQIVFLELAWGNLALKHDIELLKGPTLGLGQSEKAPNITAQTDTTEQVPAFPAPVAVRGAHHVWQYDSENDACCGLHSDGNSDCATT